MDPHMQGAFQSITPCQTPMLHPTAAHSAATTDTPMDKSLIPALRILSSTIPTLHIPSFTIPAVHIPSSTIPSSTIPSSTIPSSTIPSSTIPSSTIPALQIPSSTIPALQIPSSTIPSSTIPALHIPSSTIPSSTIPALHIPSSIIPALHIPSSTIPALHIPSSIIPALQIQPYTIPALHIAAPSSPDLIPAPSTPNFFPAPSTPDFIPAPPTLDLLPPSSTSVPSTELTLPLGYLIPDVCGPTLQEIDPSCSLFDQVEGLVLRGIAPPRKAWDQCKYSTFSVLKIEEVDNKKLKRAHNQVCGRYRKKRGKDNKRMLFHGTPHIDSIVSNGFDMKCAQKGRLYGRGIYLSEHSSVSNEYALGPRGCGSHRNPACPVCPRRLLVCQVALGCTLELDSPDRSLKGPPPGFNSVRGPDTPHGAPPHVHVVYGKNQVYPMYSSVHRKPPVFQWRSNGAMGGFLRTLLYIVTYKLVGK